MADYHLHLHPHADDEPVDPSYAPDVIERYVEGAAANGVSELGFTEHLYRCVESADALGRFWDDEPPEVATFVERFVALDQNLSLERYVETVVAAKDRGLPVRLGLEVDFFPATIEAVLGLLDGYPFDFLIGSVHWVGGLPTDVREMQTEMDRRGFRSVWEAYTDMIVDLGRGGHVDSIAHVDVLKKYGQRLEPEPLDLYDRIVEAAVAGGTAVEVSSQGLRKPVAEAYPAPNLLSRLFAAGVPITLASDGHRPDEAGDHHAEIVGLARSAGYTEYLRFEGRTPIPTPLPAGPTQG
ncbi:MAG: histidinol-phosphatase HisJ family protein [Acidimicrobiia bacterium]